MCKESAEAFGIEDAQLGLELLHVALLHLLEVSNGAYSLLLKEVFALEQLKLRQQRCQAVGSGGGPCSPSLRQPTSRACQGGCARES